LGRRNRSFGVEKRGGLLPERGIFGREIRGRMEKEVVEKQSLPINTKARFNRGRRWEKGVGLTYRSIFRPVLMVERRKV